MQISQLRVRIGEHEHVIKNCDDKDPDVAALMRMSTSSKAVVTIKVPPTPSAASALGRLVFGERKIDTRRIAGADEHLPSLSKGLDELKLSPRTANGLRGAGLEYIWHIAERSEAELLKIKGFGSMSLGEVKRALDRLGLQSGMDLSSIKDRLPT